MLQAYQPMLFEQGLESLTGLTGPAKRHASRQRPPRQPSRSAYRQLALPVSPSVMVREFHSAIGGTMNSTPTVCVPNQLQDLRLGLIKEEVQELADAISAHDLVAIADALGDIVYVTFGAALTFGVDLDAIIAEIHRSNMTKLGRDGKPILRSDGKVLKGPDYSPPRLVPILASSTVERCSALNITHVAPAS
jgi:predicted HAD superfamily Cof-like phosphohydrolase